MNRWCLTVSYTTMQLGRLCKSCAYNSQRYVVVQTHNLPYLGGPQSQPPYPSMPEDQVSCRIWSVCIVRDTLLLCHALCFIGLHSPVTSCTMLHWTALTCHIMHHASLDCTHLSHHAPCFIGLHPPCHTVSITTTCE